MKKPVSLKDIAQKAGVSSALVSYVLNGKEKEARVGKEIAVKIRKIAKSMNYQPNLIARSLKFGKTKTIGLIVADISNPFFSSLARVIEHEANLLGYTVIFGSSDENTEKANSLMNALVNRQVDGIIITPVENSEKQIGALHDKQISFVLIDRYFPKIKTNSVYIDNYDITYRAVQHLVDNGYKKIGMIAYDSQLEHMRQRIAGYEEALKENGIRREENWLIRIKYTETDSAIARKIEAIKSRKIDLDSLLFGTVSLALKSLRSIYDKGIKVPDDLGLISFDESEVFDFFPAPLTYIRQDIKKIGQEAVSLLMESINQQAPEYKDVVVNASLVVRASSRKKSTGFTSAQPVEQTIV